MSITRFLVLFFILVPAALAQDESLTSHDVTLSFGNLDIDEDGSRFLTIMNKMNSGVTTQPTFFDMSEEVLRLDETMHLGKYFAVKGSLGSFGKSTIQAVQTSPTDGETVTYTLSARYLDLEMEAVGKLPLFGDKLVAYGGVGANFNNTRYTLRSDETSPIVRENKETDLVAMYSAGFYSVIAKKFVFRLDYTKSKLQKVATTTTTLGFGFRYH